MKATTRPTVSCASPAEPLTQDTPIVAVCQAPWPSTSATDTWNLDLIRSMSERTTRLLDLRLRLSGIRMVTLATATCMIRTFVHYITRGAYNRVMTDAEREWMRAVEKTWVVRPPKQTLATFGTTNIAYYVVTEPIYSELSAKSEGVVRKGRVIAEKPAIVTPTYAMNLEGFSPEAYEYIRHAARSLGPNHPGILYRYKNQAENFDIVSGEPSEIAHQIADDLEERKDNLSVVMVGVDEWWDVALLKFIYEFTSRSAGRNVGEMSARGLLDPQEAFDGAPRAAINDIERLFRDAERGGDKQRLERELVRWGLFDHYQDRFLALFRRP